MNKLNQIMLLLLLALISVHCKEKSKEMTKILHNFNFKAVSINKEDYVRIEGLGLDGTNLTTHALIYPLETNVTTDIRITDNFLIHNCYVRSMVNLDLF